MEEAGRPSGSRGVTRLQEEQGKVISGCQDKIQYWKKIESEYDALQERLRTLPDKLSYDIMVPFGPLAFMPGRLVCTNEVSVLLGDNWFAKCSAKQALDLVDHRKKHVRKAMEDLQEVRKNFESRVEFTKDLEQISEESSDYFDIREEASEEIIFTKGKHRTAHTPNSKPKPETSSEVGFREGESKESFVDTAELWARLEELEKQEELRGEMAETSESPPQGRDARSEERKENAEDNLNQQDRLIQDSHPKSDAMLTSRYVNGSTSPAHSDEEEESAKDSVATIHFSHTVEPKRVRINTGKNTTLKYSEKKEEARRKRKNSNGNGHPELPVIKTPADIYRVFVDVVNGEYVPRKSIMKSRSRENSVCSDTSENGSHEPEDRRGCQRSISTEDSAFSDHSEDDDRTHRKLSPVSGPSEAFSGTVVEKELFSISVPVTSMAHPVLPTIQEKKAEELTPEASEQTAKRVSKFKAARIQLKM